MLGYDQQSWLQMANLDNLVISKHLRSTTSFGKDESFEFLVDEADKMEGIVENGG